MKHPYNPTRFRAVLFLAFTFLFIYKSGNSQVFWTENFGTGCSQNQNVVSYTGVNGTWTETSPGVNGTSANDWFISATEAGMGAGNCGDGCLGNPALTNRTLHVASVAVGLCPTGDCGASYNAGPSGGAAVTDKRAESPTINCTGHSTITLAFVYMEKGAAPNDDGSVWYFDGITWSLLTNPPATNNSGCAGQGRWTAYSFALPASANNNPNVKIGFHWVNNDDGVGTDPSFAVDDITLSSASAAPPTAMFSASPISVCVGAPVNFIDNSLGAPTSWSYTFPGGSPASSTLQNPTGITWAVAGTYSVTMTATNVNGSSTATVVLTVNPNPTVTATASATTICSGQSTTLTGGGASTYVWNPGNISGGSVVVSPAATTTYTVTGTSAAGCTATAQVTITVNVCAGPIAAFTASATSVCIGDPVNFTDNSTGVPTSWSWTFPSGTPPASTSQNVTGVTWSTAGTYTVTLTATNINGSSNATQVITVNPAPNIIVSANPTTICVGQSSTLNASGASTYLWNPGSMTGSNPVVSPVVTTTYTVVGTSATGCTNSAQVTVIVQPCNVPQVGFTASDTTLCIGDCINFTDQSLNSPTSWSWTFAGASTGTSTVQNPTNICYPAAGTYAVTLVAGNANGNGTLVKTGYIIVNPAPVANAGPDATICTGQQTTLVGSGGVTYNWMPGNLSGSSVTVTPASTTTYTLTVTDANGCTGTDMVTITVSVCSVPVAALTVSDNMICQNSCVDFTDMSTGTPTGWAWSFPGATPSTSTQQNPTNICYNTVGNYSVTLISTNAFGSDTIVMPNYITVGAMTTVNAGNYVTIAIGNSTTLSATGGTGTYNWSPSSSLSCSSCQNPVASPTVTTTYTVSYTNSFGCVATDTVTVDVIVHYSLFVPGSFSPNGDQVNDILFVRGAGIKSLDFIVYDRFGEKVFESTNINDGWDGTFHNKECNTGIYVWYVIAEYYDGNPDVQKGDVSLVR